MLASTTRSGAGRSTARASSGHRVRAPGVVDALCHGLDFWAERRRYPGGALVIDLARRPVTPSHLEMTPRRGPVDGDSVRATPEG